MTLRARMLIAVLSRCALALGFALAAMSALAPGAASAATQAIAWGGNEFGQLGRGTSSEGAPAQLVSGLSEPVAVAAGHHHSLALLSNGTVMAWGANSSGQLGNGTTTPSSLPVPVSGLSEVTAISAGSGYSLALRSNGTVWAWGGNPWGELGNGTLTASSVPVEVKGLKEVTAIAAGRRFAIALLHNGTVQMWGYNGPPHEGGELGQGTPIGPQVCSAAPEKERHAGVRRPRSRAFASRKHESVYCSPTPLQVQNLSGVVGIAAGVSHSLAVLANGSVMGWGANSYGELGVGRKKLDAGKNRSWIPVQSLVKEAAAVAAGDKYSLVLLRNGTAVGMGKDVIGELGDGGASRSQRSPVPVSGLSGAIAIAAGPGEGGQAHSLALLSSGIVMAWGANNKQQLGDGSTTPSTVPVTVQGVANATAISAGGTSHNLALVSK